MREHGTLACYRFGLTGGDHRNGCRCDPCRQAVSDYERQRRQRIEPAYVGAGRARAHARFLAEQGVGLKTLSARSGVSHGALWKLMYGVQGRGPSKRIRRETEQKILAVQPADRADGAKVPAGPTWQVVGHLLDRGWTKAAIGRAIGQAGGALQLGERYVTAANARAIAALLDEPVPPRRSRFGLHPVPQPEVDDDQTSTEVTDLPRPPKVNLTAEPWRAQAACRLPNVPVWIFFPARGDTETTERALAVCRRCPARADCLEVHLDERDGIWGGTTGQERRRIRRERDLDDDQPGDESEVA